jgi:hypothetical protein
MPPPGLQLAMPALPALPLLPAPALALGGIFGEIARIAVTVVPFVPPRDGSYIGIQTDKGSYSAGETIQGYVVLQNNSPRQVDSVVAFYTVVERTRWEEETVIHRQSGEGATFKSWDEYKFAMHVGEVTVVRERIEVSRLSVMLAPGPYSYPFQHTLRADLPGVVNFAKTRTAQDPARAGRPLETFCEVVHTLEACMDMRGAFDPDLTSKQVISVTPAFNWLTMQPKVGERVGAVMFCCCLNQGNITLSAAFDRAAYMAGETAQIKAGIRNDSDQDCRAMTVRLVRNVSLRSSQGHSLKFSDVMCKEMYPGVTKRSAAARDLPLPLCTSNGPLLPGTKGQLVDIVRFAARARLPAPACARPAAPFDTHTPLMPHFPPAELRV